MRKESRLADRVERQTRLLGDLNGDGVVGVPDQLMRCIFCAIVAMCILLCNSNVHAQCGDPDIGSCCEANLQQKGCENVECCELICQMVPSCCNSAWGGNCAFLAKHHCVVLCGDCGSGGAGDCCSANSTPYCKDAACCSAVCDVDPSCCDAEGGGVWDESCADLAWQLCPDLPGCSEPPPPACGDSGTGNCCHANDSPFCWHAPCCEAVCDIDPYCCDPEGEWDICCAELAAATCPHPQWPDTNFCDPPPTWLCPEGATGDCCDANGTPGCNSPTCCAAVCAQDPFCCDFEWDSICANQAWSVCDTCEDCDSVICDPGNCMEAGCNTCALDCCCDPACFDFGDCCDDVCDACPGLGECPPLNPADLTGNNHVGVPDLLILLQSWGECQRTCSALCPADFDGDGHVGVSDLLFLLQNWG